jgi:hypothetical protein
MKIKVSLFLAVVYRIKINVLKAFPSSPTKKFIVNLKITASFYPALGEPQREYRCPGKP